MVLAFMVVISWNYRRPSILWFLNWLSFLSFTIAGGLCGKALFTLPLAAFGAVLWRFLCPFFSHIWWTISMQHASDRGLFQSVCLNKVCVKHYQVCSTLWYLHFSNNIQATPWSRLFRQKNRHGVLRKPLRHNEMSKPHSILTWIMSFSNITWNFTMFLWWERALWIIPRKFSTIRQFHCLKDAA